MKKTLRGSAIRLMVGLFFVLAGVMTSMTAGCSFQAEVRQDSAEEAEYFRRLHPDHTYLGRVEGSRPDHMPVVSMASGVRLEVSGRNFLGHQYLDIGWQHEMVRVEATDTVCLLRGDRFNIIVLAHQHPSFVQPKANGAPSR